MSKIKKLKIKRGQKLIELEIRNKFKDKSICR